MKNWIKIFIAVITLSIASCNNNANEKAISHDSTVNVIIDSNAIIPDTNSYYDRRPDSTNLPDEPGPTITPADTAR